MTTTLSERVAGDLSAAMAATLAEPPIPADWDQPSAAWRNDYTPERAHEYAGELRGLVQELDEGFPGWREREKFHERPPAKVAWIKPRLLRVRQIVKGDGAWGVRLSWQGLKQDIDGNPIEGKPFAVPVRPSPKWTPHYRPIVSVASIARETGRSTAHVRRALEAMPRHRRDARAWVSEWSPPVEEGLAPQPHTAPPVETLGGAA